MAKRKPRDHLYAVASTTRKLKFGRSHDVFDQRRSTLQSSCCEPLFVVAVAPEDGALEGDVKAALWRHQLHGEWFSYEILNVIARAQRAGQPFGITARQLISSPPKVRDHDVIREHRRQLREAQVNTWFARRRA